MANYSDNSQFSCRFCEAAPFKAATGSLGETTKLGAQMGPAHHTLKSQTASAFPQSAFLGRK